MIFRAFPSSEILGQIILHAEDPTVATREVVAEAQGRPTGRVTSAISIPEYISIEDPRHPQHAEWEAAQGLTSRQTSVDALAADPGAGGTWVLVGGGVFVALAAALIIWRR